MVPLDARQLLLHRRMGSIGPHPSPNLSRADSTRHTLVNRFSWRAKPREGGGVDTAPLGEGSLKMQITGPERKRSVARGMSVVVWPGEGRAPPGVITLDSVHGEHSQK